MKSLAFAMFTVLTLAAPPAPAAELSVGDTAPDFTLKASDGKTYKLADFRNKETVVLAWFPQAYSRDCTAECRSLAKNGHLIKKYQAMYFMISVDAPTLNDGFAADQHADFPILSDPSKVTASAYGILNTSGVAHRRTFYIAPDGKILAIDKNVRPATAAEDMAATLAKLGTPVRK